jgi:hypothetical protein
VEVPIVKFDAVKRLFSFREEGKNENKLVPNPTTPELPTTPRLHFDFDLLKVYFLLDISILNNQLPFFSFIIATIYSISPPSAASNN